jgi:hypothetical protein
MVRRPQRPDRADVPGGRARTARAEPAGVSRELLTRDPFQPATSVNALVAPWLQLMIRDWFTHGPGDASNTWTIRLEDDDPWPARPMQIPRTPADRTRPPDGDRFPPPSGST